MVKDAIENEILLGDTVVCCCRFGTLGSVGGGRLYTVTNLNDSTQTISVKGHEDSAFNGYYFLKIAGELSPTSPNYDAMADKIIKLINSKPWSPSRQDIITVLRGEK